MINFEHIYIHWPFCKSKCDYCDFLSFCDKKDLVEKYHFALCKQIELFSNEQKELQKIKTIFFGGGTPSLYPIDLLKELFVILNKSFDLRGVSEITIEANPSDVTIEKLEFWQTLGINRLSMGVQILDDNILENVGRKQKVKEALSSIEIAKDYFDNISIDLILGLPGSTAEKWLESLKGVVSWPIKHISVYLITLYNGSKLTKKVKNNEIFLLRNDTISNLYEKTVDILANNGFMQYEISNFAKKNEFRSLHNTAYWDRSPYLGFGLGASSFNGKTRLRNEINLNKFIEGNTGLVLGSFLKENLTSKQELMEVLMLSLRQNKGLDLHSVLYFLKDEEKTIFLKNLNFLKENGLVCESGGGKIFLSLKGMLLENEVVLKLLCDICL